MGFGVMAALRTYPNRYKITQRHIQLTNKANGKIYSQLHIFDQHQSGLT
jgi:hypothetical protein